MGNYVCQEREAEPSEMDSERRPGSVVVVIAQREEPTPEHSNIVASKSENKTTGNSVIITAKTVKPVSSNQVILSKRSNASQPKNDEEVMLSPDNDEVELQTTKTGYVFPNELIHGKQVEFIQKEWKKRKENDAIISKLKVLEANLDKVGKYIPLVQMRSKTSPIVLKIESNLPIFEGFLEDREGLDPNLVFRRPFLYYPDNSIYHGNWSQSGLREGYGVCVRLDGSKLEGLWRSGNIFKGRIIDSNGSYYEGEIKNGDPEGVGKRISINGTISTGNWKKGKQTLFGEKKFWDNYIYRGNFSEAMFNGKGTFIWPDGSIYEGEFKNSSFEGYGTFKNSNGDEFNGLWFNNQPNGKGHNKYFSAKNKNMHYDGMYKNGQKDGEGKFFVNDKTSYVGHLQNDVPHGHGVYRSGTNVYEGIFRYGRLVTIENKKQVIDFDMFTFRKDVFKQKDELLHLVDMKDGIIAPSDKTYFKKTTYNASPGQDFKLLQASPLRITLISK